MRGDGRAVPCPRVSDTEHHSTEMHGDACPAASNRVRTRDPMGLRVVRSEKRSVSCVQAQLLRHIGSQGSPVLPSSSSPSLWLGYRDRTRTRRLILPTPLENPCPASTGHAWTRISLHLRERRSCPDVQRATTGVRSASTGARSPPTSRPTEPPNQTVKLAARSGAPPDVLRMRTATAPGAS
jgi:hypothetical protein